MRYSLHNMQQHRIAEAATLQGIADKASPGTFAYDCQAPAGGFPVVAYTQENGILVGHPFRYRCDAIAFLRTQEDEG